MLTIPDAPEALVARAQRLMREHERRLLTHYPAMRDSTAIGVGDLPAPSLVLAAWHRTGDAA